MMSNEQQNTNFYIFQCESKLKSQLTNESKLFIKNQLWINVLKTMSADEQSKNEMLDYCREYYRQDKKRIKSIDLFSRNYTPNDSMKYLTKNSFIYNLLNNALLSQDYKILYKFRFYILNLCFQIENERKQVILKDQSPIIVHRNEFVSKDKFFELMKNINNYICINNFLLASYSRKKCLKSSRTHEIDNNMIPLQITIYIHQESSENIIFANVEDLILCKSKQQIIFTIGTVFRIDSCYFDENISLGKMTLTVTDEGSNLLQSYMNIHNDEIETYSKPVYFGRFLINEINDIDLAEEYFQLLVNTLPNDHSDLADIYNQIGTVHYLRSTKQTQNKKMSESELNHALQMFEKALEIQQNVYDENHIQLVSSLTNLGLIYTRWKNYDCAYDYYQRGLTIVENNSIQNHVFIGNLYYNLGILKERINNYNDSISFYIKSNEIYSHVLHVSNPTNIKSALKIAELSLKMNDTDTTEKYYEQAFEYCDKIYSPHDKIFQDLWIDIVRFQLKFNRKQEATKYLERVIEISNEYVWFMAQLCTDAIEFESALQYYKMYYRFEHREEKDFSSIEFIRKSNENYFEILKFKLSNYEILFSGNDLNHAVFLINMAQLFVEYKSFDFSNQCYRQAFEIYETKSIGNDASNFEICWKNLIDYSFKIKNEQLALDITERVMKICKGNVSKQISIELHCLQYLSMKYEQNNNVSNALNYIGKAFAYAEIHSSYDDLCSLLKQIFEFSQKRMNGENFNIYFQRAIKIYDKDNVQLGKLYWTIGDFYQVKNRNDKALECYLQCFVATQADDVPLEDTLDQLWIDFVTHDRSEHNAFDSTGKSLVLEILLDSCRKYLLPHHFKEAILLWQIAILYEQSRNTNIAARYFEQAIEIFENSIYRKNSTRAKRALTYLINKTESYPSNEQFLLWLENQREFSFPKNQFVDNKEKWKCILYRLKTYKMMQMNDLWNFHLQIENLVSKAEFRGHLFDEFIYVCRNETNPNFDDDCPYSLDITSRISAFEFVSHWYFSQNQFLESLLYRQQQLHLEMKIFNENSHVALSLWFIGLIFQKTNEFNLALGYLSRALKILHRLYSKVNDDIEIVEKQILQTKKLIVNQNSLQIEKPIESIKLINKLKFTSNENESPLVHVSFHID